MAEEGRDNSKLAKFRHIIMQTQKYLDKTDEKFDEEFAEEICFRILYRPDWIHDFTQKNEYVRELYETLMFEPYDEEGNLKNVSLGYTYYAVRSVEELLKGNIFYAEEGIAYSDRLLGYIEDTERYTFGSVSDAVVDEKRICVFWYLFLAAIDDEIYNTKLNYIVDVAYCLGFDEAMMRDWCRAVNYILVGNQLAKGSDLVCETEAGKALFLHQ